jgi:hypothetical protein
MDSCREVEGHGQRVAANTFTALLRAGLFEDALHGLRRISDSEIATHARAVSANMLVLLNAPCLCL